MYHQLATRFGRNSHQISGREPLDNEALYRHVPSIFASEAHDSRSERYVYVPTIDIVEGLRREGWFPFFAVQSVPRDGSATQSTCCACVGMVGSASRRRGKSSSSTAMTGRAPIRCLPGCSVSALGLDAADASPDHWRHLHNRLSAGLEPSAYTPERHAAWIGRRRIDP